ncbi:hypothetical protein [Litchfieldella xinjiangensis]|uniref:hypothetical protein n=1 Tax=Litchfieldella xinjiangensis TaxID=1166948 RepID=UPI0005BB24A9|nr:hypothetical protein [Halomonas xinjiangensis]
MKEPPRTWPDGRPVGGTNGYPPEYAEWLLYCQALHVAKQMLKAGKGQREGIFKQWEGQWPGVTRERVREAMAELSTKPKGNETTQHNDLGNARATGDRG